jgi:hypothetical protein
MTWDIILVQVLLGVSLFFIINWIGEQSYSIGYISMSLFVRAEEAPAFNFVFRILTPIVYLLITSAILYAISLDKYVNQFYFVNIFYVCFRLLINLLWERGRLLNWWRTIFTSFFIISFSILAYENIIFNKKNLLPDFTTLSNEIWIIILLFIYHLFNGVSISQFKTIERKNNYYLLKFNYFESRFSNIIDSRTENDCLKCLIYSILIYENFNRPRIVRFFERVSFWFTHKEHTLGIMQVKTSKNLSDLESVKLGTEKIISEYNKFLLPYIEKREFAGMDMDWSIKHHLITKYNGGAKYLKGVEELYSIIFDLKYSESKMDFFPPELNNY